MTRIGQPTNRGLLDSRYLKLTGGTMSGNIVMGDGGTIGQVAGPLIAFDDTNNYLEITGCNVGIGTTAPGAKLQIGTDIWFIPAVNGDKPQLRMGTAAVSTDPGLAMGSSSTFVFSDTLTGAANSASNIINNFNNYTALLMRRTSTGTGTFIDAQNSSGGTLFKVDNLGGMWAYSAGNNYFAGNVGIGTTGPYSLLDVSSTTGGILTLSRADTSVTAADLIGQIDFHTTDTQTTTNLIAAEIKVSAANTITTDINPGIMDFLVTGTGVAGALIECMSFQATTVAQIGFFGGTPVVQQTGIAAQKINYTTGDLDTEAEVIAAFNTTNTAINALRTALNNLGLTTIV